MSPPSPASRGLRRGWTAVALLAILATARRSSAEPPPWTVESPGGAGAPVVVGLDGLYDDVDRLTIRSAKTTVTLRDPEGGISVQRIDGDPALLNRKFKVGWSLTGVGGQIPLALPHFDLGGAVSVYPSLVLQAASVQTTLSTRDLPEPAQGTSLDANGVLVGATLGVVVPLCKACRRFAVAGYRYRLLPGLSATGSPPLGDSALQVTRDDAHLRQSTSDLFLRYGQTFAHGRVAASLGIVGRRTQIDVRDEVGFSSELGEQTSLDTRTRYDRHATGAIADLDAHLGGPFFARAEVIVAGSDRSALLKVAYLLPKPVREPPAGAPPDQAVDRGRRPGEDSAHERSPEEVAAAIAGPLRDILAEYRARAAELAKADPPYPLEGVAALFDDTERKLIEALSGRELAALRASVVDFFIRAREALDIAPRASAFARSGSLVLQAVLPPRRGVTVRLARNSSDSPAARKARVDCAGNFIARLLALAEERRLQVRLVIKTTDPGIQATFSMHPERYLAGESAEQVTEARVTAWRGSYVYTVHLLGFKDIQKKLDLFNDPDPQVLECRMVPAADRSEPQPCRRRDPETPEECP